MRYNNGLIALLVMFILMMVLSTIFSFVFKFFPIILIVGVIWYAYHCYKTNKKTKEAQVQQEQDNVYENFFDNQTIEGNNAFDKDKFFSHDQFSDLKIMDATVVEKKDSESK